MLGTIRKAFLVVGSAVQSKSLRRNAFWIPLPPVKLSGQSDVTGSLVKVAVRI